MTEHGAAPQPMTTPPHTGGRARPRRVLLQLVLRRLVIVVLGVLLWALWVESSRTWTDTTPAILGAPFPTMTAPVQWGCPYGFYMLDGVCQRSPWSVDGGAPARFP